MPAATPAMNAPTATAAAGGTAAATAGDAAMALRTGGAADTDASQQQAPQQAHERPNDFLTSIEAKKVLVLGSTGCGKSMLINCAVGAPFSDDYRQTFGADMAIKYMMNERQRVMLQIWCCGGHERYRVLLEQFYATASVVLLTFDLLNAKSFQSLTFWHNEVKRACPSAYVILVGTKIDEADSLAVKISEAVEQGQEWGADFVAVSAKTGVGIDELFAQVLKAFV
ncbi:hypothetical protein RI367_002351 [Sorochytrium milnesiophthora]